MLADADLATVAQLMSGHRAGLLLALLGGRPLAAGRLASRAGISRSLTSRHLSLLLDGGLIAVEQEGRNRYYRLAGPAVAEAIEGILTIAPHRIAAGRRESEDGAALRAARTCYDHLAGALGVALADALARQGLIELAEDSCRLTEAGDARLGAFGLDLAALRARRRAFARPCLDWTERRPHLAGALGAGLADRLLGLGWVQRLPRGRALRITPAGARHLRDEFGLNLSPSG